MHARIDKNKSGEVNKDTSGDYMGSEEKMYDRKKKKLIKR